MKLSCGQFELDLTRPQVMGILNVTPDSFSDGGCFSVIDTALKHAHLMIEKGADILDIGGESTRPGAAEVSEDEELARVIPVIEALSQEISIPISIDTSKATVMYEAVQAGASIINDVSALRNDKALETAAKLNQDKQIAICLMHMQGKPRSMQESPDYQDVVIEVIDFLKQRASQCIQAGINKEQIIIDPGFGFGKSLNHNLKLFNALHHFVTEGYPVLVGVSRKSLIGQITGKEIKDRLAGSLALATLAVNQGVQIIRTHDVSETRDVLDIVQATKMLE